MKSNILMVFVVYFVGKINASVDEENLDMSLMNNQVNLNFKCQHYTDCYNCTLARCDWGPIESKRDFYECNMPVVENFEEDGHKSEE
jgi:hypothetical protein